MRKVGVTDQGSGQAHIEDELLYSNFESLVQRGVEKD